MTPKSKSACGTAHLQRYNQCKQRRHTTGNPTGRWAQVVNRLHMQKGHHRARQHEQLLAFFVVSKMQVKAMVNATAHLSQPCVGRNGERQALLCAARGSAVVSVMDCLEAPLQSEHHSDPGADAQQKWHPRKSKAFTTLLI